MRLSRSRAAYGVLLLLAVSPALARIAAGQPAGPAPITVKGTAFPIPVTGGTYDLYDLVVDFPPGSATPRHYHGGPVVITVITGELTLQRSGGERVVTAGDSFLENPGDVHALVNKGTTGARVAASELIPKGAAETTIVK